MTQRKRQDLEQKFKNGERPDEVDFGDVFDSFLNKEDDRLTVDEDGNLTLYQGLVLGPSSLEQSGALRFDNGQVEYHNGLEWVSLTSGGGAFQPIGDAGAVVYEGGNVGIGTFGINGPTYRLEVQLDGDTDQERSVRFGPAVIFGNPSEAYFSHRDRASIQDFGFRQERNGRVRINAPDGRTIRFDQGGNNPRLTISANGNVIVGSGRNITNNPAYLLQVDGSAFKNDGQDMWNTTSDLRVKEDIRDLEVGLEQLRQIRPVRFRYNGKAGTPAGKEGIGIIGQEIETILPETIQQVPSGDELGSDDPLRIYNGSALTYVLVNAVKELAAKVQQLEAALADARQERSNS